MQGGQIRVRQERDRERQGETGSEGEIERQNRGLKKRKD